MVLVDAPRTIGHNLLRAISAVTVARGLPSEVTRLVYSHSHADHTGASGLFGPNVVQIGHQECARLLEAPTTRPARPGRHLRRLLHP